jgi:hypothetical protein
MSATGANLLVTEMVGEGEDPVSLRLRQKVRACFIVGMTSPCAVN